MRNDGTFSFSDHELDFLLSHLDETLVAVDDSGRIVFASPRLRELAGYEPETMVDRPLLDLVAPGDRELLGALLAAEPAADRTSVGFVRSTGEVLETVVSICHGPAIQPLGRSLLTLVPARPREALEHELERHFAREDRLTRLATMFVRLPSDQFDDGILTALAELGASDRIDRVSLWRGDDGASFTRTHSWASPATEAAGHDTSAGVTLDDLWPDDPAPGRAEIEVDDVEDLGPERAGLAAALRAAGTRSLIAVSLMANDEVKGFVSFESVGAPATFGFEERSTLRSAAGILSEMFARRSAEELLDHQARHDDLTGLTNRWACLDALADALERVRAGSLSGLTIALVDVDRFKVLNDWLGHSAGDRVLVAIADRLRAAVGSTGGLNRLGGDELLVVIEGAHPEEDAVELARGWQQALLEPFEIGGQTVFVTVSIGVACIDDASLTPSELVQRADAAMYRAKQQGRNRIDVFDEAQRRAAAERLAVRHELRSASARGELQVHYQPERALADGRLVGVEAFVRWDHPRRGMLDAGQFLPLADQDGVVHAIGDVVLDQALSQAQAWREGPAPDLVVGVNLSDAELFGADLLDRVADALARSSLPAAALRIDVEENTLMLDPVTALAVLERLKGLGVQLAMDGFGIGNTSLAFLRRFPVDSVRISPVQVAGLDLGAEDGPDATVVRGIVRLARTFGLRVSAVGVETQTQLNAARTLGCDSVQGYLVGRPVPAERTTELLSEP